MHSRFFLNLFAALLIALCLLALLLFGAASPAEAPSAAVISSPAPTLATSFQSAH